MVHDTTSGLIPGRSDRLLLVGVARSGTRWLGSALGHAQGVRFVKEPDNVDADPSRHEGGKLGLGPYPVIEADDDAPAYRALWDLAFAARVPNRRGWRRSAARAALRLPRTVRDPLLRRSAQVMAGLPGRAPHTLVKTIYAPFALDWIVAKFDPRVVVIQRHPLNVVSSWAELGVHGFDLATRAAIRERYVDRLGLEPPSGSASNLELIAWWVGLLTTVISDAVDRHPGWLLLTHEDLCADPPERMRAVCRRVGLTWTAEVDGFLTQSNRPGQGFSDIRVTRDQPTRWRERLTDLQVAEIEGILARFPGRGWIREPGWAAS